MQLRFRILIALTFIYHTLFAILPLPAHSEPVLFITENLPPIVYTNGDVLKGYNIELVRRIWKNMNLPELDIKVQPWPRSIKYFDSSTPTCLFPVALTEQRKKNYRYITTPISFEIAILTHKKNEKLFATTAQIKRSRMCIPKATSFLSILRKQGYTDKNFDFGTTLPCSVKKFSKGRTPLIVGCIPNVLYNYHLIGGDPSELSVLTVIATVPSSFLFNNAVPQQFIDGFQKAMDQFVGSEEEKAIYNKEMLYYYPRL